MEKGGTRVNQDAHDESGLSLDLTFYSYFLNQVQRTLEYNGQPVLSRQPLGSAVRDDREAAVFRNWCQVTASPSNERCSLPCSQAQSSGIASVTEALEADSAGPSPASPALQDDWLTWSQESSPQHPSCIPTHLLPTSSLSSLPPLNSGPPLFLQSPQWIP